MAKVYKHLGFRSKANDKLLDFYNRINVVKYACQAGLELCLKDARTEFDDFVKGNYTYVVFLDFVLSREIVSLLTEKLNFLFNSIPVDFVPVVYRTVVEYGAETEWNYLWSKFKSSNLEAERHTLLEAMGYTTRADLLKVLKSIKSQFFSGDNVCTIGFNFPEIFRADFVKGNPFAI